MNAARARILTPPLEQPGHALDRLFHQADAAGIRLTPAMGEGLAKGNPRMIAYVADLIAVRGLRPAIETRHDGGLLDPGKTYTVNENGPEAVVDWDGQVKSMGDGRPALVQSQKPAVVLPNKQSAAGSADLPSASRPGIPVSIAKPGSTSTTPAQRSDDFTDWRQFARPPVAPKAPLSPSAPLASASQGGSSAATNPSSTAPSNQPALPVPASGQAASPPGYGKGVLDLAGQMKGPLHRWSEYFNRKRYNPDWPSSYQPVLATPNVLFTPVAEENDGDWQQHIVDNAQNVLVHYPSINGVIGASM